MLVLIINRLPRVYIFSGYDTPFRVMYGTCVALLAYDKMVLAMYSYPNFAFNDAVI